MPYSDPNSFDSIAEALQNATRIEFTNPKGEVESHSIDGHDLEQFEHGAEDVCLYTSDANGNEVAWKFDELYTASTEDDSFMLFGEQSISWH